MCGTNNKSLEYIGKGDRLALNLNELRVYVIAYRDTGEIWTTLGNKWFWKRPGDAKVAFHYDTGCKIQDEPQLEVVEMELVPSKVCS